MPFDSIKAQLTSLLGIDNKLPEKEIQAINRILDVNNTLLQQKLDRLFSKVDHSFDVKNLSKNILPKSFCSYAFKSLTLEPDGSARPCCKFNSTSGKWHDTSVKTPANNINEIFNQKYIEDLRLNFLSGAKPDSCNTCWMEENIGIPSMRQRLPLLDKWDNTMPWHSLLREIDSSTPKSIELKLSNICNLKCRSCNGYLSSRWIDEEETLQIVDSARIKEYKENSREKFIENPVNLEMLKEWAKDLTSIQFYGGEPLLQTEHDYILETLVNTGYSKNISISYCTNGTICRNRHFELWNKFKNVYMNFSLDAIGARAEYIRHPCKWSEIEGNIAKFIQNKKTFDVNIQYNIVATVSILNVLYLDELTSWASDIGLVVELNLVHHPNYLSIKNGNDQFKQYVIQRLETTSVANFPFLRNGPSIKTLIEYIKEPADPALQKIFFDKIMLSDGYRHENFSKIFPELYELIK